MRYVERINNLVSKVPSSIIDFSVERTPARVPTQVSSNFITNKQQGDWAEKIIFDAINNQFTNYVAVRYGKSDDLIAGDEKFSEFFQEFQQELDEIGKRPDILVFRKQDFNEKLGLDISKLSHQDISNYVKKAVAGLEIRSSAFLIEQYESAMNIKQQENLSRALKIKANILENYSDLLSHDKRIGYIDILNRLNEQTINMLDFRTPSWSSSDRLIELKNLFKELKCCISEFQKRDYLSITPKVEDIKVVHKWIETFNVPHFYFQVFFDKVYGVSFENILSLISDSDNEGKIFSIEQDNKNQNKTTIKINSKSGVEIANKVDEPEHQSIRKEMARGRLLFYVSFNGGKAYLDVGSLSNLLSL